MKISKNEWGVVVVMQELAGKGGMLRIYGKI